MPKLESQDKSQIPAPQSHGLQVADGGAWGFRPTRNPGRRSGWGCIWNLVLLAWCLSYYLCFGICHFSYAQSGEEGVFDKKEVPAGPLTPEPITVNGDVVEYSTNAKEVTATGNVFVTYKNTKLSCHKLTVNTQTKDGLAEGNARLEDAQGVIEGEKISFNFQNKKGTIIDSQFRSNPFFGRAERVDKISDAEFISRRGYMSTCSYNNPHYRMKSRRINFFPGDKIQTKDVTIYVGRVPVGSLPQYNHSLKDPIMHVQIMPGSKKDWGPFLLTAWRYSLNEYISGRIYLDLRSHWGMAEGFGANYTTGGFGKGDFKYYYAHETPDNLPKDTPADFQRYLIRWRHQWDLDEKTNLVSEYYKLADSKRMILGTNHNILKDYFFREYEKDSLPLSYTLLHHNFGYSSMDLLVQKRTNRWYTQLEKLPEIKYSLPSIAIGNSPFYFENSSQAANFNYKYAMFQYAVPNSSTKDDINMIRFDTYNAFSLPMKISFIQFKPFAGTRETLYNKEVNGSSVAPRTIFYSGAETSTKFYRVFNVKSNFLRMDINGLRHIITPTVNYTYNHEPTIKSSRLKQIDSLDALTYNNSAALELSNKLQTKRENKSVDLLNFRINSSYNFRPKIVDSNKTGGNLSDLLFDLELLPYSWMSLFADATYKHSGNDDESANPNYKHLSSANYDISFNFGEDRSLGFSERYQRKGSNEFTTNFIWRLNPKWKISVYERFNQGNDPVAKRGLREQQYILSRDLHCWTMEFTYNVTRDEGESVWLIFRLKAFPELEFGLDQSYHQPKPGSSSR